MKVLRRDWLFSRSKSEKEHAAATGYNVVLPKKGPLRSGRLSDSARHLVDGIRLQAQGLAGEPVEVLVVDANRRRLWRLVENRLVPMRSLGTRPVQLMMNPSFLLADPPPLGALEQQVEQNEVAWCGAKSSRDTYAFGFTPEALEPKDLWGALAHLTVGIDDDVAAHWERLATRPFLAPARSFVENSPALQEVSLPWCPPSSDSPRYLNTAMGEIMSDPRDCGTVAGDPERMAQALLAQRSASRVPWIFNALLNEIDYRLGRVEPLSFPLEVHLSITGACNIECLFCGYTHDIARFKFVDVAQIARLDFLRNVQTLRLHSGLGEPTMNKHLPAIIEHVSKHFPHLGLNFFTNGVALNRPGIIPALVGNVRWINVSINASTRESWKELCKVDLFERVRDNLIELHRVKRSSGSLWPLVFGSMVLTKANLAELPRMPVLCRELGVDRFTAFPYFGLGYKGSEKFGAEMTLEACRDQYDDLYRETLGEAEENGISLEIPSPSDQKQTHFGQETRPLRDFAGIESNEMKLGRFLTLFKFEKPVGEYCHFLWRSTAISSTHNQGHTNDETHYLYPCLGPLSSLDLSRQAPFRFPDSEGFVDLWRNPVFSYLRKAQHQTGVCAVCDVCRKKDTRDPGNHPLLERLLAEFKTDYLENDGEDLMLNPKVQSTYAVTYLGHNIPARLPAKAVWGAWICLKNDGSRSWQLHHPEGKKVDLVLECDGQVLATHEMPRSVVQPGEQVTIHFPLRVPNVPGDHEVILDLVEQNVTMFRAQGVEPVKLNLHADPVPVSRSTELYEQAARISPWYYQPSRGIEQSRDAGSYPLFVSRAKGCNLWDLEGRQYIDYVMGWGCALLGYADERVQKAVMAVMDSAAVVPFPHSLEMDVARMLTEDIPCAEMVVFGKNGSDVCTLAARVARVFTGKKTILFSGYHGWQDWWVEQMGFAASGVPDRPQPLIYRFKPNDLQGFMQLLEGHREDLAAVMLEPSGAAEGVQGHSQDVDRVFLEAIAKATRQSGALLIYDEIMTGFRYPDGGLQKATGVIPDLACMGKALSAGMPLSALVGKAHILQRAMENTHYGPTFKGEVYSFAAAREALRIYRAEPVAEHVWSYGSRLKSGINHLCDEMDLAAECVGPPFRMVLVFEEPDPERLSLKRTLYHQELLKSGVVTYNGFMLPSYAHDDEVMETTLDAIGHALEQVSTAEQQDDFHRHLEIPLL